MKVLLLKIREAALSVLPVTLIVIILNFTPLINLSAVEIGLFNLGADLAMSPMGEHIGSGLSKSRKPLLILLICFAMGVLITVAEPDLSVLAGHVSDMV